jgi:hypothetical protein
MQNLFCIGVCIMQNAVLHRTRPAGICCLSANIANIFNTFNIRPTLILVGGKMQKPGVFREKTQHKRKHLTKLFSRDP